MWPGHMACCASSLITWTKNSWMSQVCALGRSGEGSQGILDCGARRPTAANSPSRSAVTSLS